MRELETALAREVRIARALQEVGIALGTTLDLDDLLELILAKLTELVEADRATLYLLDEAHNELVCRLVVGRQVRSIRMKVGHGIAGTVAQTGKADPHPATPTPTRASSREWDAAHRLPHQEHAGRAAEEPPRAHDRRDPGAEQAAAARVHAARTKRS